MTETKVANRRLIFLSLLSAVLVAGVFFLFMGEGGITPDSISYLTAAQSLHSGRGLQSFSSGGFTPLTHFPPVYPTLLALSMSCGLTILKAAKIINCVSLGTSAGIFAFSLFRFRIPFFLVFLAVAAFCVSIPVLDVTQMAWSESLFLMFIMAYVAPIHDRTNARWFKRSAFLAVIIATAILTRYVGIALLVHAALRLGQDRVNTLKIRIGQLCFLVGSVLPLILWRWYQAGGEARSFVVHPAGLDFIISVLFTVGGWFVPATDIICLLAGIGVVSSLLYLAKKFPIARPVVSLFFLYILILWVSKSFFDADIPINDRMLSPLLAMILFGSLLPATASSQFHPSMPKMVFGIIASLSLILTSFLAPRRSQNLLTDERFPAETMQKIAELPFGVHVYSNAPDFLYLLTGRITESLPEMIDPATKIPQPDFEQKISLLNQEIDNGEAKAIFFRAVRWRSYLMSESEMKGSPTESDIPDSIGWYEKR